MNVQRTLVACGQALVLALTCTNTSAIDVYHEDFEGATPGVTLMSDLGWFNRGADPVLPVSGDGTNNYYQGAPTNKPNDTFRFPMHQVTGLQVISDLIRFETDVYVPPDGNAYGSLTVHNPNPPYFDFVLADIGANTGVRPGWTISLFNTDSSDGDDEFQAAPIQADAWTNLAVVVNPPLGTFWGEINGVRGRDTRILEAGQIDGLLNKAGVELLDGIRPDIPNPLRFDNVRVTQAGSFGLADDFAWKADRSGDWNLGENWSPAGGPPGNPTAENRANHRATFGEVIQSNRAVFSETDVSVRAIVFDNTNTYAVGGPGSVSLVQGTGLPAHSIINVANGTHEFQLRVELQNNTTAEIASGSTLEFNNRLFLNGHTLSKTGPGTIAINNDIVSAGGTVEILEGTVMGVGTIGGDINNTGGTISPGANNVQATSIVPEPATWMMLGLGLLGWLAMPRKHR